MANKEYAEKNLDLIRQVKPVLNLDESAVYLGCSGQNKSRERFILAFEKVGLLKCAKIGREKVFQKTELDKVTQMLFKQTISITKNPYQITFNQI